MSSHKHHIIPRHTGGSNHPSNIVVLSVEEHAEAHRKLYEEHGRWQDKIAADMLSEQIKSDDVRRKICRARMINDNPMKNPNTVIKVMESRKWYKPSQETKEKMSASMKGKKKLNTENMNKASLKTYLVITPDGEELIINNMPKFCSINNLQPSLMYKVASGNRNTHKKFKCCLLYHEHSML
jgi:hypothetical protein